MGWVLRGIVVYSPLRKRNLLLNDSLDVIFVGVLQLPIRGVPLVTDATQQVLYRIHTEVGVTGPYPLHKFGTSKLHEGKAQDVLGVRLAFAANHASVQLGLDVFGSHVYAGATATVDSAAGLAHQHIVLRNVVKAPRTEHGHLPC